MAREKFQTLTEQMFYVLLALREECCGTDVMARIANLTQGRVTVGPGTLYNLLESFQAAGWIMETKTEGRRRSYLITPAGEQALAEEYRFQILAMEVMPDHIHLLVNCKPQFFISDMIKIMKGNLARQLFLSHPELKKRTGGRPFMEPLLLCGDGQ